MWDRADRPTPTHYALDRAPATRGPGAASSSVPHLRTGKPLTGRGHAFCVSSLLGCACYPKVPIISHTSRVGSLWRLGSTLGCTAQKSTYWSYSYTAERRTSAPRAALVSRVSTSRRRNSQRTPRPCHDESGTVSSPRRRAPKVVYFPIRAGPSFFACRLSELMI